MAESSPRDAEDTGGRQETASFSVDTQLFRELGELLVGRDSTALIELVKNAYDADATQVLVYGQGLEREGGAIVITDNGIGMTLDEFRNGFLRLAARGKTLGDRRSRLYGRRFTGEKGVGRLAAHKLARELSVRSVPGVLGKQSRRVVFAVINWDSLEKRESLEDVGDAIHLETLPAPRGEQSGTEIRLGLLRQTWDQEELARFLSEAQAFSPPEVLCNPLPKSVVPSRLLFTAPEIRDQKGASADPGFRVEFGGDFEASSEMWDELVGTVEWIVEVEAKGPRVKYVVSPTLRERESHPEARRET
jgi:hypothetical protein